MQTEEKQKIDVSADFEDEQNDLKNITYPIDTLGIVGWIFTIFGISTSVVSKLPFFFFVLD